MAWTISRPLGLRAGMGACAARPHTDCCGCIPVKSPIVTWHHSNTHTVQGHRSAKPHTSCQVPCCHVHTCRSHCCELVDTHALSTHRSRVLVCHQFSLPAYLRVTIYCHFFGRRNGGRLIRKYTVNHKNVTFFLWFTVYIPYGTYSEQKSWFPSTIYRGINPWSDIVNCGMPRGIHRIFCRKLWSLAIITYITVYVLPLPWNHSPHQPSHSEALLLCIWSSYTLVKQIDALQAPRKSFDILALYKSDYYYYYYNLMHSQDALVTDGGRSSGHHL